MHITKSKAKKAVLLATKKTLKAVQSFDKIIDKIEDANPDADLESVVHLANNLDSDIDGLKRVLDHIIGRYL